MSAMSARLVLGVLILITAVSHALAAVRYVNVSSPSPAPPYTTWATAATRIQDAVDVAVSGDEVLVTNGVYQTGGRRAAGPLTNRVSVTNALMVRSVNGPAVTVIEGFQTNYPNTQLQVRCVFLTNGAALSGFTLTNGAGRHIYFTFTNGNTIPVFGAVGGGVWCASPGSVVSNCVITGSGGGALGGTLNNCTLAGNFGDYGGGANYCTLNDCSLTGNTAVYDGGGAHSSTLNNCVLTGNSATNGGGAFNSTLNNCTLIGNSAEVGGGAFQCSLNNCILSGNSAGAGGGASECILNNCTLAGNSADDGDDEGSGGGAYGSTLTNCTLTGNSAAYGGGAEDSDLNNCTIIGNLAGESGGGANYSTLNNCTLSGNLAVNESGGGASGSTLTNCTLVGNSAAYGGGANYCTLNNCVLSGNSAEDNNSGFAFGGGAADSTLNNCTLTGNSAESGGGGAIGGTLNNCIVYYNTAANGAGPNHLYSTLNYSCATPMPPTGVGNIANEPVFIDLPGSNLRLASNSPCINAGNNAHAPAGLDLDGNPRIIGTVDLGAYEYPGSFYIGDAIVSEGNAGTANAVFVVGLGTVHSEVVSVDFTTVDGSATAGSDYLATNGTLIFNPGETYKAIIVPILGDTIEEAAEVFFFVRLSNSTNIVLTKTQAVGIIFDDDTVPLSFTGVTMIEGNTGTTNAVFALRLARPYILPVSVDFATADGSAVAGADYIATSGTVTFAPGETDKSITVLVNGDLMHEEDEMFFVNLSHPVHASLTSAQAIGTILDGEPVFLLHVNVNNPNPVPPYTNWATAATTIQDAIDVAVSGDEILVTNGVYQTGGQAADGVMTRVVVNKPITVRSVNGPSATIIAGYRSGNCPYAVNSVRCVYLVDRAVLMGFTLTNGSALCYGKGGGVWCASTSAVLSNCVLTGNSAYYGAGAYSGTLNNCVLNNNGGDVFHGGGAYNSTLNNCVLTGNSATYGGGASSSTLNNCTLSGNSVSSGGGGGTYSGTLNNCVLNGNTSADYGGGTFSSVLNNCTLTANSARNGGGAQDGTLNNCIVYFNIATAGANYAGGTFNYSCTTPLPIGGVGNFTNAPLFVNQVGGNFRLQSNSPCINAGNNAYAVTGLDLDGNPRIVGSTVDVGAYEFQSPQSLISYAWLQQYGLPINPATDSADPDGDRLNNYQEWRAGTDPTKPLSVLRLITVGPDGSGGCFVRFTGGASRSYQLQRATNVAGPWTSITTATAPASELIEFHDTNAPPGSAFYRTATTP